MTDQKRMLDKFDPLGSLSRHIKEQEALMQRSAVTAGSAVPDPNEALNKSLSEQVTAAALRSAAESMQSQLQPSTLGLGGTYKSTLADWAEMEKAADEQQERIALALAWNSHAARPAAFHKNILGLTPAIAAQQLTTSEEQMRHGILGSSYQANTVAEQLRFENMLKGDSSLSTHAAALATATAATVTELRLLEPEQPPAPLEPRMLIESPAHDHFARENRERQKRESAKLDYARRSAEASEQALEAERQRTAAALEEAAEAKKEAKRDRRILRISLWITGASLLVAVASLLVAALPYMKD